MQDIGRADGPICFEHDAKPIFPPKKIVYPATLDGKPVTAGVTSDALVALGHNAEDHGDYRSMDRAAPVHDAAKALIQRVYARRGLDRDGAVFATAQDVKAD
jgi:hypothetical protein